MKIEYKQGLPFVSVTLVHRGEMIMSEFQEITARSLSLPDKNRAELAEMLIQSLEDSDDSEVKSAWLVEIRRRDAQIKSGQAVTKPAAQVLQNLREKFKCMV